MPFADPKSVFRGTLCVMVPHMDDGVLACGGTAALLGSKSQIHFVYATDGARSPAPALPWVRAPSPRLTEIRKAETAEALGVLGIPESNAHFLDLPDNRLRKHSDALCQTLLPLIRELEPEHVLIPFRYDRHPDHLTLNRTTCRALRLAGQKPQLFEYFVYYRWRLLPGRDVRALIREELLTQIDISSQSSLKRQALECFRTQTTRYFPWQNRPILTAALLDEVCDQPELFLGLDATHPGPRIFERGGLRFRLVHRVEPPLKRLKEAGLGLIGHASPNTGRPEGDRDG